MTALDEQIGGAHYKDFAIQPVEFIHKNDIGFIEGNIIKYICRYKSKGKIDDLKKVKHYVEILIELSNTVTLDWNCYCRNCTDINEGIFVKKLDCKCPNDSESNGKHQFNPLKCLDCGDDVPIGYLYCNKCKVS